MAKKLTPPQERLLLECKERGRMSVSTTYKPFLALHSLGLVERCYSKYQFVAFITLTPAGREIAEILNPRSER